MCHLLRKRGEAGREVYCDANIFLLVQLNQKTICLPLFSQIYWKVLQYFSKIYWKITVFPSVSSRYNGKSIICKWFFGSGTQSTREMVNERNESAYTWFHLQYIWFDLQCILVEIPSGKANPNLFSCC